MASGVRKPAVTGAAAQQSTAHRIVEASIQLFNQHGIQDVPMLRIAAQVGISSGNLAYHFRSKRDILLLVLPMIDEGMRTALRMPVEPPTPQSVSRYQIGIFRTLWRFRFYFNALAYLLADDAELRAWYLRFQEQTVGTLRDVLNGLIEHKHMRGVPDPNNTELVATNMWLLWLSWLRFEQINDPATEMVEDAAIYDGALRHFSLMQPYYGREFASRLLEELGRNLRKRRRSVVGSAR